MGSAMKVSRRRFNLGLLCSSLVGFVTVGIQRLKVRNGWVLRSED